MRVPFQNEQRTLGIRPPPWQDNPQIRNTAYGVGYNGIENKNHRDSSNNPNNRRPTSGNGISLNNNDRVHPESLLPQQDPQDRYRKDEKATIKRVSALEKQAQQPKTSRFSLGIFGNKKDKKAAAAAAATISSANKDAILREPLESIISSVRPGTAYSGDPVSVPLPVVSNVASKHPLRAVVSAEPLRALSSENIHASSSSPFRESTASGAPVYLTPRQQIDSLINKPMEKPPVEYVRAMWNFTASIPTEMSVASGEVVAVIHKQIDGWWEAETTGSDRRQRGLVPGNYMQPV
ncbi:hypothetical protein J3Q64DRAFT_1735490 [Phycomyces blakesleeanus]|uniref:SH3 domain-containing protein n=1 Tax=Phycomyces blakesleeanus TaxID=4837 RepID=A0ABR3B5E2_PHYBL